MEECNGGIELEFEEDVSLPIALVKPVDVVSSYPCDLCNKNFSSLTNVYRHQRVVHDVHPQKFGGSKNCPENSCLYKCGTLVELRSHLRSCHAVQLEEIKLTFPSMTEFTKWREEEERSSKSLFIATTSTKKLRDGSSRTYLNCHRSGQYKSKSLGKRKLKVQGSCKIDRCCPASMKVAEHHDMVIVNYCKTHRGHNNDNTNISHMRLTDAERALIAGKLAQGITFEYLLDDLQSSSHDKFNRFHLVTKKDLHNIRRDFKLQPKPVSKETETLESWLEKSLAKGQQSSVLYCKDRGVKEMDTGTDGAALEADDFLLVLANPVQREMLARFGPGAICIDYTEMGQTQEFSLTTVVVVDEFDEPFPVAFCLSNRADITAFQRFFTVLHERVGNIEASVLISDDFPALYWAWGQVMGEYEHHLLCPWFTEKCWKSLIEKIPKAKTKRSTVHRSMKALMEITEIDHFNEALGEFVEQTMQDKDTEIFACHFQNQFALRPEMWAHCYLGPKWTSIIGDLEAMHRLLHTAFCQGRDFAHVVRCLKSLNKLVRERNCSRLANNSADTDKVLGQPQIEVSTESIQMEATDEDHIWRFEDYCGEAFQVQKTSDHCGEHDCGQTICAHTYSCTCIEFVAGAKSCHHIETVAQLQQCPQSLPVEVDSARPEGDTRLASSVERKVETLLGFLKKGKLENVTLKEMEQQMDKWIDTLKSGNKAPTQSVVKEEVQPVANNTNSNNNNIVLLICPPSVNGKVPISRYNSPLQMVNGKMPISRYKSPLDNPKNRTPIVEVHSGFDHVY